MDVSNFDSRPVALEIKEIVKENETTNTYVFEYDLGSKPGQFVMLWIPGVDEKPFSVAYDDGKEFWLTICKVGPATEALFELKVGDKVGIRGPYGTCYEFEKGEKLALVSGGYGAAPMYNVTREALKKGAEVDFFTGARDEAHILYQKRIEELKNVSFFISTDDGSKGHKGYITEVLEEEFKKKKYDKVFSCGPELMMKRVGEIAAENNVECFLSMEKYMKCGFGVCGQCCIDDSGECVCKSGPVMAFDYIKNFKEFGKYHRDAQGNKHNF